MFRRKHEFKPDKTSSGILNKLYITPKQRRAFLKWLLMAAFLVFIGILQDVILSRVTLFGATFDLMAAALLLSCVLLDPEIGCIFALTASVFYWFSGSAPGPYVIGLLTVLGVFFAIVRHCYLHDTFGSVLFCAGAALFLYEAALFGIGLFMGFTTLSRWEDHAIKVAISLAAVPLMYPVFVSIEKFGGKAWND